MSDLQLAFESQFPTDEDCYTFFYQMKWPDGYCCPHCSGLHPYIISSAARTVPIYECRQCRHQTSLTAGTVMEGSRTSLRKWLFTLFLIANPDSSLSAVRLSSLIEVTYKTAWSMLHKIRKAIGAFDETMTLSGMVQASIAFYGSNPLASPFVLGPQEHPVIAAESKSEDGNSSPYIKIKTLPRKQVMQKAISLIEADHFIQKYCSDKTDRIAVAKNRMEARKFKTVTMHVIQATSWINRTFHGLGGKYLQHYLNEFCYRINHRHLSDWSAAQNLASICTKQFSRPDKHYNIAI